MSYCYFCGKEEIQEPTGRFNMETGEPLMAARCPVQCLHNIHRCEDVPAKWWHILTGYMGRCKDCGKHLHYEQ